MKEAIFSRNLQEVSGAINRDEKLNDIAQIINQDDNYNMTTILTPPEDLPRINGTVFTSRYGDVAHYFIPKSIEHCNKAAPTVSLTLGAPNTVEA